MNKRILLTIATLSLVLAITAGCGNSGIKSASDTETATSAVTEAEKNNSDDKATKTPEDDSAKTDSETNTVSETTAQPDQTQQGDQTQQIIDESIDNVNMDAVDGAALKSSKTDGFEESGKVGPIEVSIQDAKKIDNDGKKLIMVSFKYKNTNSEPTPFLGYAAVKAYQNDSELPVSLYNGEGYDGLAATANVEAGKTVTVQRVFSLSDETTPVVIEVSEYADQGTPLLSKTFTIQ